MFESLSAREGETLFKALVDTSGPALSLACVLKDAGAPQYAASAMETVRRTPRPLGDSTARAMFSRSNAGRFVPKYLCNHRTSTWYASPRWEESPRSRF